jgi:hypothetical protein
MIWFLLLFSLHVPAFEGGQYQSRAACQRAARIQLSHTPGLSWQCVQADDWEAALKKPAAR